MKTLEDLSPLQVKSLWEKAQALIQAAVELDYVLVDVSSQQCDMCEGVGEHHHSCLLILPPYQLQNMLEKHREEDL